MNAAATDMALSASAGWHRKWLLLCAALVWLYFLRFRVLGWLLSRSITLALHWKQPRLRARVQIHHLTLRPLELSHVDIYSEKNHWRFVCTRVAIQTHVLEYFRSFVQKKILVVAVDDVFIDLLQLDEDLVREVVAASAQASQATKSHASTGNSGNGTNASGFMGFMRFIDLRVHSTSVNIDVLETSTRVRCTDLRVEIPDVCVSQNYLHLSIAASSFFAASKPLQQPEISLPRPQETLNASQANALCCELTDTRIVLDIRLTDRELIGCTVASNADEPAYVHIDTAYVEQLLTKKMDLIRCGLFPIPTSIWQHGASNDQPREPSRACPFTLRIAEFPVTIDVIHRAPGGTKLPLQVTTHIRHLTFAKKPLVDSTSEASQFATTTGSPLAICLSLDCQRIDISSGIDSSQRVLSMTAYRVEMERNNVGQGRVQCDIGEVQLAVTPSVCEVLHSLVLFPDTIDEYERASMLLMFDRVSQKLDRPVSSPQRKIPVHWDVRVDVKDWLLQAWLHSAEALTKRDLEARGKRTTLRSSIPPKLSGLAIKHQVELSEATVQVSFQDSPAESTHRNFDYSIQFGTVSALTSKLLATSSKSMEIKLSSSSVVLNGHTRGRTTRSCHLPGIFFADLVFQQTEIESNEMNQTSISLTTADADCVTSHARHGEITKELRVVFSVLDHVRLMLTPPEPIGSNAKPTTDTASKIVDVNVCASSVRVQLADVDSVSPSVEVRINEIKAAYLKAATGLVTTVTCAFVKMLWSKDPVMDIAGVRFYQTLDATRRSELCADVDVDATASTDVSLSHMQLWLQPERRLLLLFLKLDELANANANANANDHGAQATQATVPVKKTSAQKVIFHCTKMGIELPSQNAGSAPHTIRFDQVKLQANILKTGTMTDAVLRYLQVTRRHESCRSRLADCIQVMAVDGTFHVHALEVVSADDMTLLYVDECLLRFAATDIAVLEESGVRQPASHYIPSKILLFDLSSMATQVKITLSSAARAAVNEIVPILQTTLESRLASTGSILTNEEPPSSWRLRFIGSVDCGVQRTIIVIPLTNDAFSSRDQASMDGPDRFVLVHADHLVLHCRQFQKVMVQFELLRISIVAHDTDELVNEPAASRPADLPLQVLYLPRTKLDAVIHWIETTVSPTSERFAVSFDLVLRGDPTSPLSSSSERVPIAGEALCCLNWDYVFPTLIYLVTDDPTGGPISNGSDPKTLECVGIQWNVSLDVVQVAWWDATTQDDSAILVVANNLLSHGFAKLHTETHSRQPPTWVLWETTVYLDLFRAYLLRHAHAEEDEPVALERGVALPFQNCSASQFFIETTGTSYRATHDSAGDGNGSLFGELAFVMADTLHDHFSRVDYEFIQDFSFRQSSSSPAPLSGSPSNGSPPKSPRAWTQSVRSKLARLKRRSSSMDNMLLNDGSRPIQVDSMKLLWTLETRDCVFNMIAVVGDSLDAITEMRRQRHDQTGSASIQPLSLAEATALRASADASNHPSTPAKRMETQSFDTARTGGRRVSTRDSLLELLQQGKLGQKHPSAGHTDTDSIPSTTSDTPRSETEEMHLATTIHDKKYTLDVHDVQINILEETTRSSALIASKHIHLEAGYDDSQTTAIATLKFECVTGHVAPLDVEVSSGVVWYTQSRGSIHGVGSPQRTTVPSNPTLLKQVMEEFTLTTTYSHGITTRDTSVEADMSSLQLSTDRYQFYQLLNVLRHVLLAPPTTVVRVKRPTMNRRDRPSDASSVAPDEPPSVPFTTTVASSIPLHTGKKLHAQLVEELRIRDAKTHGTNRAAQATLLKLISFRSAGCVFRLRTSPESSGGDQEFVEIRVEGITGSHSFFASQNTKLVVNLQWMEINNLRPGPSSTAFEDAMAVLKAKLLIDQRYQSSKRVTLVNQKGMLTVRAESGPLTRVLGQKLRILDVLEISIFPEIRNMIVIQLAADFYELLYKFFFEQITTPDQDLHHHHLNGEHVLFGKKGSASGMGYSGTSSGTAPPPSPLTKSRACTSPASPPHPPFSSAVRRKSIQSSGATTIGSESALTVSTVSANAEVAVGDDDDASADGCELFYFKYVRIGNVRLRINCNGFFVNLSHFDLDLPPFVSQSRLCTWKKLLQKFESHLRWYVTKESASTGLSHFKNKLLKWTPTASSSSSSSTSVAGGLLAIEKKEKNKKEENTTAMNAQVLFGPYSGTQ